MFLERPARRPDRRDVERHPRLFGGPPALFEIARRAGGDDILPRRTAALRAGDDMIEGEIAVRPAILAGELVAQEEIEAGEGGELGRFHILLERDQRRKIQPRGGTSALALVMVDECEASR